MWYSGLMSEPTTLPPHIELDQTKMAGLAREMAIGVKDPDVICMSFGITQEQFDRWILPHPFYKKAYEIFVLEWESALSTNKRIAIQSAAALEDALPKIASRMTNGKEGLSAVTETAKMFAKLAGAGEEKHGADAGEKFTITINLGADTKLKYEETIRPPTIDVSAEAFTQHSPGEVRALPKGPLDA